MRKDYILFIDSGIGGLSTLSTIIKHKKYRYIYYADNLHAPYGAINQQQIYEYLKNIINLATQKYSIPIVVLACNTATTAAIDKLREHFSNITFVGTEPAISLAKNLKYKNIACIATNSTIKQNRYWVLTNSLNIPIKSIAMQNLATKIEKYLLNQTIKNYFELLKDIFYVKSKIKECDCLVLGCTHYVLIKDLLKEYIHIPLIDGNTGVSNTITNLMSKRIDESTKNSLKIFLSNDTNELKQKYIKILKQTLAKT